MFSLLKSFLFSGAGYVGKCSLSFTKAAWFLGQRFTAQIHVYCGKKRSFSLRSKSLFYYV